MSIKLALLKSGESVIADVKELVSGDKLCGYLFDKPHTIDYRTSKFLVEEKQDSVNDLEVCLIPWIIFSEDEKIPVNPDWIVTIVKPVSSVIELYEEKVNEQRNQTDSSNEQTNLSE